MQSTQHIVGAPEMSSLCPFSYFLNLPALFYCAQPTVNASGDRKDFKLFVHS